MHWQNSLYLYLLILIPILAVFFLLVWKRKQMALQALGELSLLKLFYNPRNEKWKMTLLSLSVLFIVLALARPQWGSKPVMMKRTGLDIVLAIDVSASMLAEDIKPNRLEIAKLELANFMDRVNQDRIGLVAFAGTAFILCPLTLDYSAARIFLEIIDTDLIPEPGTALGEAIQTSALAYNQKEKKHKVLILLSDGEDHQGAPVEAAKYAAGQGIRIYTIGIGSVTGEPIPIRDKQGRLLGYKKDAGGSLVISRLDEVALQKIASESGGKYFHFGQDQMGLDQILEEISGMEKKQLQEKLMTAYQDRYQIFLFIGFMLLALESIIPTRKDLFTLPKKRRFWQTVSFLFLIFVLFSGESFAKSAVSLNNQGTRAYQKENFSEATKFYQEAAIENPRSTEIQYNLGNALHQQTDYARALNGYQKALQSGNITRKADTYYNLGNTFYRMGQLNSAVEAYKECLKLNPSDQDAKFNLELALKKIQEQKQPRFKQQPKQSRSEQKKPEPEQQSSSSSQNQKELQSREFKEKMSKEEADRFLKAFEKSEKDVQKRLKKVQAKPSRKSGADW